MKTLVLLLALVISGCATWTAVQDDAHPRIGWWRSSKWQDDCNMQRALVVEDVPDRPEKYLYVLNEQSGRCLILLRPAFASDTGRTWRWNELPDAFDPSTGMPR